MTKWIKLHNDGEFDVVTAIGMLGASVKNCDDPIGLYGSGIKYAMAQALRQGISLKISDKGTLYTLTAVDTDFRGETFKNVSLKTKTGKIHKTGITTDFGKEDWNDSWFIFREFYSNCLDEGGTIEIVNGVQPSDSGVDVFLPYAEFKEIVDNIDDYFCPKNFKIKPGTGRVFKKGVWVGNLRKNPGLDFQNNSVEITETRTLNNYSAWRCLESRIECDADQSVLVALFKNPECWMEMSNLWLNGEPCNLHVHDALVEVFGSNYIICPDIDWIIKDAEEVYNRNAVLFPKDWNLPQAEVQTMNDLSQNIIFRDATPEEQKVIDRGIKALSWMNDVPTSHGSAYKLKIEDMNVRVLKTNENCGGLAKKGTPEIAINANVIEGDFTFFVETLMHESIHAISGEGDYTRGFAGYMERALAQLST